MSNGVGSTAIFGEPTASLFQTSRAAVLVERSAAEIWSVLTDLSFETLRLWNPGLLSVKHISGVPGTENHVVLLTKDDRVMLTKEEGAAPAPFYMRAIRMVPQQQRVLRIDTVDGSACGFVDHSLYPVNGKTKVVYSAYLETRRVSIEQVNGFDYQKAAADMMGYLHHTHDLLRQAIEGALRQV